MSRGAGRIERAIRVLFDAHPDLAFVTDELAEHCYPDTRPIQRKHQIAVLRAAWNVIKDDPDWHAVHIRGQGNGYLFCNAASVQSTTIERMIAGPFSDYIHRSEKRAWRRPLVWVRAGPGFRAKRPVDWERQFVPNRAQLLQEVADGRDPIVADHVAWRDGDETVHARLRTEHEAAMAYGKMLADRVMGRAPSDKCYEAADVGGNETLTGEVIPPTDLSRHAAKARSLMVENDPDAIRAGLAEIAAALDERLHR